MKLEKIHLEIEGKEIESLWYGVNRYLLGDDRISGRLGQYCGMRGIKTKEELIYDLERNTTNAVYFLMRLETLLRGVAYSDDHKQFIEGLDERIFTNPNNPTGFKIVKIEE